MERSQCPCALTGGLADHLVSGDVIPHCVSKYGLLADTIQYPQPYFRISTTIPSDWHTTRRFTRTYTDSQEHMSHKDESTIYQIKVKGHLSSNWSDWYDNMTLSQEENGYTLLTGPVIDQAALHGLLRKIRDLGLVLVSVHRVDKMNI